MEEKFNEILEKDEQIIKVLKPHKGRYFKSVWLFLIPLFWPHLIMFMVCTLFTAPFFAIKAYNNTYYCFTNKRLIIRKGIFGNSYSSLDYKNITSISVNVGLFDKKTNTGSLTFVSPSSHHEHPTTFAYIQEPYKIMNEIKEQINIVNKQN